MPGYLATYPNIATHMIRGTYVSLHACLILDSWAEGKLLYWDREHELDFKDEHLVEAGNALTTKERARLVGEYNALAEDMLHNYNLAEGNAASLWVRLCSCESILSCCSNRTDLFKQYKTLAWKMFDEGFTGNELDRGFDEMVSDQLHFSWVELIRTLAPGDRVAFDDDTIPLEGEGEVLGVEFDPFEPGDDPIRIRLTLQLDEHYLSIPKTMEEAKIRRSSVSKVISIKPEVDADQTPGS